MRNVFTASLALLGVFFLGNAQASTEDTSKTLLITPPQDRLGSFGASTPLDGADDVVTEEENGFTISFAEKSANSADSLKKILFFEVPTTSSDLLEWRFEQPLFFRDNVIVRGHARDATPDIGCSENIDRAIDFNFLTMSGNNVLFQDLCIHGKIQATARANVTFRNCKIMFDPHEQNLPNCIVECLANSNVHFENCTFEAATEQQAKALIVIRNRAFGLFKKCVIKCAHVNAGVFAFDNSVVDVFDCVLDQNLAPRQDFIAAVYACNEATACVKGCKALEDIQKCGCSCMAGENSNLLLDNCNISKITVKDKSIANILSTNAKFIHVVNSEVFAGSVTVIPPINGQAIKLADMSFFTGEAIKIQNSNKYFPSILLLGSVMDVKGLSLADVNDGVDIMARRGSIVKLPNLNYPKGRQPVVFVAASDIHHDGRLYPRISSGREIIGTEIYYHGGQKTDFPKDFGGWGIDKDGDFDFLAGRTVDEPEDPEQIVGFSKRAQSINVMGDVSGAKTADDYSLEKSERMAREYGTKLLAKRPFLKQPPAQNPQGSQALPEPNPPIGYFPLKKTMNHDCPICLDKDCVNIVLKPCGHGVCSSCFKRSGQANTKAIKHCPICRSNVEDFFPFIPPATVK
jgi:hypothetical protein